MNRLFDSIKGAWPKRALSRDDKQVLNMIRSAAIDDLTPTLPPYAPELNPMENVWAYLRSNKLAISVFDSYDEILDKCQDAWNFFANAPNRISSITHRDWVTVN